MMAELADIRDKDQVEENKQEIMKNHICTYKGVLDPTQVGKSLWNYT